MSLSWKSSNKQCSSHLSCQTDRPINGWVGFFNASSVNKLKFAIIHLSAIFKARFLGPQYSLTCFLFSCHEHTAFLEQVEVLEIEACLSGARENDILVVRSFVISDYMYQMRWDRFTSVIFDQSSLAGVSVVCVVFGTWLDLTCWGFLFTFISLWLVFLSEKL